MHNIGRPIFDSNWETKTWVQVVPFPRNPNLRRFQGTDVCPFYLFFFIMLNARATCVTLHDFFHHIKNRQLRLWNITTLGDYSLPVSRLGGYRKWVCLLYCLGSPSQRFFESWENFEDRFTDPTMYNRTESYGPRALERFTDFDAIWRGTGRLCALFNCTLCRLGSCWGWLQTPRGQLVTRARFAPHSLLESWVSISKPYSCWASKVIIMWCREGVPRTLASCKPSAKPPAQ